MKRNRLKQLRKLAEERPEYFYHQYIKELRNGNSYEDSQEEDPQQQEQVYEVPRHRVRPTSVGEDV